MHERLSHSNTHLPEAFHKGYELCFFAHDLAAHLLKSGCEKGIFSFAVNDIVDNVEASELIDLVEKVKSKDILERLPEILISKIFPAVLSDLLHYVFEALEAARKGKLSVAFTLLRKPLQDNLFVLESIIEDECDFSERLACTPPNFNRADDITSHRARIASVLDRVGYADVFDANYLAQLRYDKSFADSFDGFCNKATHLITSKSILKTSAYSLNFIFSTDLTHNSQWSFLFSRLPYVLAYSSMLCEHISERFALTYPEYKDDMNRRMSALYILNAIEHEDFLSEPLANLALHLHQWLEAHCKASGYQEPDIESLQRMGETGAFPGEAENKVQARFDAFESLAKLPF
ncbi:MULTISPECIES: hypothetical protein [Pseudomonas syringae group]|uniref:Uncharacterized protein n=2 Tax=Pseudomonas syringae group TaxID=136849 RepID=A0AAE6UKX2_9PSED|nr:hypothetical protein [Pseudomonas coronafaciens]QGT79796.1 hypothetical protein GMO17_00710 [Pseudomonas coronafaciens pv. coronafaciens]